MTLKQTKLLLEATTLLYGVALLFVAKQWAPEILPWGWIAPAFFYLYELAYLFALGKFEKMQPQKMVFVSLALRGVKFLSVAAMLLIWVVLELPEKSAFLLYTLGFYLLSSLVESLCVKIYAKDKAKQQ
ncbi:MAG: hypothetical protein J6U53_01625 [Tidjanibacter sp.]|nr:hypothetical protein [Tidjanibacter sp.]